MKITSYDLNSQSARSVGTGTRITEKGAYVGKFLRAEAVEAKSGSTGIEFTFESADGLRADYLSIWTHNAEGKELYGRKMLDAIMTCLKARKITVQSTPVKRRDAGGERDEQAPCFRELMGQSIGLFLIVEEYFKSDGGLGSKMSMVMPFEAATRRTAHEVLDNLTAGDYERILASLRDKPAQQRTERRPTATRSAQTASGTGFDNMDDDIPF